MPYWMLVSRHAFFWLFLLLHVYLLFEGRMVTDYGFIAFFYFFSGDNWPLDQVFWLLHGFHGGSERYDNPRKILHKEHAHWWRSQSKYNFIFISSPELKAQVSFSDHLSSICLSVCLSVRLSVNFSNFSSSSQNHWANFNQTWHKASLGRGVQFCSKEGPRPFLRGDNYEIAKINWQN